MIYGYARVSTKGQERYGNSLPDQEEKLHQAGCDIIFCDSFTGTKMNRPEFSKLMSLITEGDTLVVTKLDRFARTAVDGITTIRDLIQRGITVKVLNMGQLDNSPVGKLMVTVMLAMAEFERDTILERMHEGKAVKKNNDPLWHEGRKKIDIPDFQNFLEKQKGGILSVDECCAQLNISRGTWYNKVREMESA